MDNLLVKCALMYIILINENVECFERNEDNGLKLWKEKKPEIVDNIIFCEACKYFTRQTLKYLKGKRSESDVYSILNDNICKPENMNFPMRGLIKKQLVLGCLSFYEIYAEYLENVFLKRKDDDEDIIRDICVEKTTICSYQIDKNKFPNYRVGDYIDPRKLDF